jgi:hypothetical protein
MILNVNDIFYRESIISHFDKLQQASGIFVGESHPHCFTDLPNILETAKYCSQS